MFSPPYNRVADRREQAPIAAERDKAADPRLKALAALTRRHFAQE